MPIKIAERLLSRISITQKILLIFLGCVVIPAILQNAFYFTQTETSIHEQVAQKMNNTLDERITRLSTSLGDLVTLSIKYNNHDAIYRTLDRKYGSDLQYLIAYQENIQESIASDLPFHLQVDSIKLYTNNPTVINGGMTRNHMDFSKGVNETESVLFREFPLSLREQQMTFQVGLEYNRVEKKDERRISVVRRLTYYPQYSTYEKAVQFTLNPTFFNTLLSDLGLFDNLLLVDAEGRVLFSASEYGETGGYVQFEEKSLPSEIAVLKREVEGFPLTLYGCYNVNMISGEFNKNRMGALFISLVSLFIAGICVLVVGNNITNRTRKIVERSDRIAKGDFSGDQVAGVGADEIAKIEQSICDMSLRLQTYIDREFREQLARTKLERETTQAKLLALQSQVNPHFMFNALETIRLNCLDHPPEETARMIRNMSKMFRHLVDWDEDIILLRDDLKFLSEFFSIQKYRFGEEFQFSLDIASGAEECRLPKLILQPLAENACVHGVEAISNEKRVRIRVSLTEDSQLILEVQDNGGGMESERLGQLQEMLAGGEKVEGSVGLYNVYQRLLLNYGEAFSFQIKSERGKGTTCRVQVPAHFSFPFEKVAENQSRETY